MATEAIEILKSGPRVDVILSDVLMPDVSGHDIRRWVRANRPAVKIVLMTGFSPETARADPDGLDAPILFKPFTREQLSTALADALGKTGRTTDAASRPDIGGAERKAPGLIGRPAEASFIRAR